MSTPESKTRRLLKLHFKPEGYPNSATEEYFLEFSRFLSNSGLDPNSLIYSGIDGSTIPESGKPADMQTIFGMNSAGWRESVRIGEPNPAEYAEGFLHPCIALYDKALLRAYYSGKVDQASEMNQPVQIEVKETGEALSELDPNQPILENLISVHYPAGNATDALLGYVFIDA